MPRRRAVLMTRQAISPRLAISIFLNMVVRLQGSEYAEATPAARPRPSAAPGHGPEWPVAAAAMVLLADAGGRRGPARCRPSTTRRNPPWSPPASSAPSRCCCSRWAPPCWSPPIRRGRRDRPPPAIDLEVRRDGAVQQGAEQGRGKLVQQLTLTAVLHSDGTPMLNNPLDPEDGKRQLERAQRSQQRMQAAQAKVRQRAGPGARHGGDAGAGPADDGQVRPGSRMPDARSLGDERRPGGRRRPRHPGQASGLRPGRQRPASGSRARRRRPARQTRGARPAAARTSRTRSSRPPT